MIRRLFLAGVLALLVPIPARALCLEWVASAVELAFLPEPDEIVRFLRTRDWMSAPNIFSPTDWRYFLSPPHLPVLRGQESTLRFFGRGLLLPNGPEGQINTYPRELRIESEEAFR